MTDAGPGAKPPGTLDLGLPPKLWEFIVDELRARIIGGELPPGTKLGEAALATRFGVSRGPIREALRELTRLGLAIETPRSGTFVATLSDADLDEVYMLREALETTAARLAIAKARDSEIEGLMAHVEATEAAYESGSVDAAWVEDMDFHRTLFLLAGSRRMAAMFDQLAAQTVFLQRSVSLHNPAMRGVPPVEVHRAIAEAVIARDGPRAERAIRAHFRYTEERLLQIRSQRRPSATLPRRRRPGRSANDHRRPATTIPEA